MAPRKQVAIGFGQFKGEGPRFYLRQFSGFFFVLAGIMCLLAPQAMGESDAPLLGVDKKYLPFVALALVLGGTYLHETRPFKRLEKIRTEIEHNDEKAEADYAAAQEGKKAQ